MRRSSQWGNSASDRANTHPQCSRMPVLIRESTQAWQTLEVCVADRSVDYSAGINVAGVVSSESVSQSCFVGHLWRHPKQEKSTKIQITGRIRHGRSSVSRGRLRYDNIPAAGPAASANMRES